MTDDGFLRRAIRHWSKTTHVIAAAEAKGVHALNEHSSRIIGHIGRVTCALIRGALSLPSPYFLATYWFPSIRRRQSWGVGGRDPRFWDGGSPKSPSIITDENTFQSGDFSQEVE